MKKKSISASDMAKLSWKKRSAGKTKKEISETMKSVSMKAKEKRDKERKVIEAIKDLIDY